MTGVCMCVFVFRTQTWCEYWENEYETLFKSNSLLIYKTTKLLKKTKIKRSKWKNSREYNEHLLDGFHIHKKKIVRKFIWFSFRLKGGNSDGITNGSALHWHNGKKPICFVCFWNVSRVICGSCRFSVMNIY